MRLMKCIVSLMMSVLLVLSSCSAGHALIRHQSTVTMSYQEMRELVAYAEALEAENKALKSAIADERARTEAIIKKHWEAVKSAEEETSMLKAANAALEKQVRKDRAGRMTALIIIGGIALLCAAAN